MGIKELAENRGNLYYVDPRKIEVIEGWNARTDYGDIEALKNSIVESGLKEPLKGYVEGDKIKLTNGHRRLTAIMQAIGEGHEIKTVPFLTEERYANEGDYLLTQILSNDGKSLTPLEQAKVFRRMLQFGWTEPEIARKTGKTMQTVRNYLELSAATPQVHEMVEAEQVSATLAIAAIKEHGTEATEVLQDAVEVAQSEGKTKATAKHLDKAQTNGGKSKSDEKKRSLKQATKEIFHDSKVTHMGDVVNVEISKDHWAELSFLLGLEK